MSLVVLGAALMLSASACDEAQGDAGLVETASAPPAAAAPSAPARSELSAEEKKRFRDAAQLAWTYLDANYKPATGFVNATPDWQNTTIWDIGGQLLAFRAARDLGFMTAAEFDKRTTKALSTLEKAPLFRNIAYNKVYSTTTGKVGEGGGNGFAATDLGRFLVALKVLAVTEPRFKPQIERVVKRIDFSQIVKNGYLHGQLIGSNGKPWTFQEGRVGYEQYVARGFSEWGADVANALDYRKNSRPKKVMGVTIPEDTRWQDRLLSEPFILYGVELGMPADVQDLAASVLRLQQARYDSTGIITIVSEDASSIAPHYFYYYCVYCSGKPFSIEVSVPGKTLDGPRWVSTKAAFGWHALMPSEYTKKAVDYVMKAADPGKGWASGVIEKTGVSTRSWDVNTASVMLEIAHFALRGGKPLIDTTATVPAG